MSSVCVCVCKVFQAAVAFVLEAVQLESCMYTILHVAVLAQTHTHLPSVIREDELGSRLSARPEKCVCAHVCGFVQAACLWVLFTA